MEPTAAVDAVNAAQNTNFIVHAFEAGGFAMYVIAAIGILTVMLIIERFVTLRSLTVDKADFNEHLFGMVLRGDVRQAITYCDSKVTPLTSTLKSGLVQVMNHRPDEEVQVAMDASVLRDTPKIEGWAAFLAVFSNVATLVGLVGTIFGMIKSFQGVALAGAAEKAALLSEGISEALHCTAFGLLVAIIGILAYGYFQVRIGRILNDVVESSMSLMNLVVANRDKMKE
ncbi:MAG TPA: MotA/TolQ/ExbB proton channel family protein [Bdellovibrionales bacterium]|nr:MotA/TolQ/ExbB proton channel family protein [Bdellovibrionales bacterium]